jgi:uncharacterized protein YggE
MHLRPHPARVSNQLNVTIHQISQVGEILDRLVVNLGRVDWITEGSDFEPIAPMGVARPKMASSPAPIERGENTITARVTIGFDIAQ